MKYTNCSELERQFRSGCKAWLASSGGVFSLALEDNFGFPLVECGFEDDDRAPNGLVVKEINLSLPPRPLCLYKSLAIMKTVIG